VQIKDERVYQVLTGKISDFYLKNASPNAGHKFFESLCYLRARECPENSAEKDSNV